MKTVRNLVALLAVLSWAQATTGYGVNHSPIKGSGLWIRIPAPGVTTTAGYGEFANTGTEPVKILSAESADFEAIEIHEMKFKNGKASMVPLQTLDIAVGGSTTLSPGGLHLMLIQGKRTLKKGDRVSILLKFAGGTSQNLDFVAQPPP